MLKSKIIGKKSTKTSKATTAAKVIAIAFILICSAFTYSMATNGITSAASTNVLQYEWPQHYADAALTHYSNGPAPTSADILWQRTFTKNPSISAFDGKVFICDGVTLWALNPFNGETIWNKTSPTGSYGSTYANYATKIDDQHLVIRYSNTTAGPSRVQWMCLDPETGNTIWYSQPLTVGPEDTYYGDYRVWITGSSDNFGNPANYTAWDFSNASRPPTLLWTYHVEGAGAIHHAITCGDGKIMIGSYNPHVTCLDARTGKLVWNTPVNGEATYPGYYYQGKFYTGTASGNMYCFDPDTGKIMWTFSAGGLAEYAGWGGAGNGLIYHCFSDSYLYALDPETGKVVWKYKEPGSGLYYPEGLAVADGKVYCQTGQASFRDWDTGEYGIDRFTCLDGKTGTVIWQIPDHIGSTLCQFIIAYGNLYGQLMNNKVTAFGSPQPWTQFHNDPARTGQGPSGPTNLELAWKFATNGAVTSSPCAADGKIFFGSMDQNIYCLNATNGNRIWNFTTMRRIYSSPVIEGGNVYIGPDDGYVYSLNAETGAQNWKTYCGYVEISEPGKPLLRSSPCIVSGLLYVGSTDGLFYCLSAYSGVVQWKFNTGVQIVSSPTVEKGMAYIASQNGTLYKFDAISGDKIWAAQLNPPVVNSGGFNLKSTPTVADGRLFIANAYSFSGLGRIHCINTTTGLSIWNYSTSSSPQTLSSPAYANGMVYFVDQFNLVCANATDGKVNWTQWLVRELESSPVYAMGKIYIAATTRVLYAINATTGEKLSWVYLDAEVISTPCLYEGKLYIGDWNVNLYCFKEASNAGTTYYGLPSPSPSPSPTATPQPTAAPTATPTAAPTTTPTAAPTEAPNSVPTASPTASSTASPTDSPAAAPTEAPTASPESTQSSNDVYIYVAVVIVVIVVIAAVAAVFLRKKK